MLKQKKQFSTTTNIHHHHPSANTTTPIPTLSKLLLDATSQMKQKQTSELNTCLRQIRLIDLSPPEETCSETEYD